MRLFVAVEVAAPARAAIAEAVDPHRRDTRVTWTRPEGWHVTLAFLGEVEEEAAADAATVATAVGVVDAGVEVVPGLATRNPVVLGRGALAVELADTPDGVLGRLGQTVQQSVAAAGLPVHQREVTPHLTLGRARRRRRVPRDLVEALDIPRVTWTVDQVAVVESILGSGPATYRTLARVPLPSSA